VFCDLVGDSDKVLFKLIQGGPSNGSLFGVLEQKTQLAPANESGLAESAVADQMVRLDRQLEVRVVKGHEASLYLILYKSIKTSSFLTATVSEKWHKAAVVRTSEMYDPPVGPRRVRLGVWRGDCAGQVMSA
jgi:hypothetical protein